MFRFTRTLRTAISMFEHRKSVLGLRNLLTCVAFPLFIFRSVMASSASEARLLLESSADTQLTRIEALDAERKDLSRQKKDIARELKNEQQKRRLMSKARNLSTEDLLNVVVSRAASAKAKAKAKASS